MKSWERLIIENSVKRRVFFSFHYEQDVWRTSQIRNFGALDGSKPVSDNAWEEVKRGGDTAIKNGLMIRFVQDPVRLF